MRKVTVEIKVKVTMKVDEDLEIIDYDIIDSR